MRFFINIKGLSNTMNLNTGNLERRAISTSDMQLGKFMQSQRIWPPMLQPMGKDLAFLSTSSSAFLLHGLI